MSVGPEQKGLRGNQGAQGGQGKPSLFPLTLQSSYFVPLPQFPDLRAWPSMPFQGIT